MREYDNTTQVRYRMRALTIYNSNDSPWQQYSKNKDKVLRIDIRQEDKEREIHNKRHHNNKCIEHLLNTNI